MKIAPTIAVRRVMRSMGYNTIYTNKYKTMRTVKCYGSSRELQDAIKLTLFALGIDVKIRTGVKYRSTIVQLPL